MRDIIKWWNGLDYEEQKRYFLDYVQTHSTEARVLTDLTLKDIEIIYNEKNPEV